MLSPPPPTSVPEIDVVTVSRPREVEGTTVAQGLARAMSSADLRLLLRDALRDSRVTDHKVLLQSFSRTSAGRTVTAHAATSLNLTTPQFESSLQTLPEMDLYMPFRAHRRAWRGTNDVLVAASFDPNAAILEAFDVNGMSHRLNLADGVPSRPLVILHPSEPKRPLTAIEPSGGETVEQPPLIVAGLEEGENGGGGSGSPPVGVYLTRFYSYRNDGWWGSLEMEFRSYAWEFLPFYLNSSGWVYPGGYCSLGTGMKILEAGTWYNKLLVMVSPGVTNVAAVGCTYSSTPRGYELFVFESDGGLNGAGDDFGRRFFYAGTIPYDATIAATYPYWSCDGIPWPNSACQSLLSVELKLEYR